MEDTKDTGPSKHRKTKIHVKSQKTRQHAQGLNSSAQDGVLELKEEVYTYSLP